MTYKEYNQAVWRAAGLTKEQVARAQRESERVSVPGFLEMEAKLLPGYTMEQAIAAGVREFREFHRLPRLAQRVVHALLDAEIAEKQREN